MLASFQEEIDRAVRPATPRVCVAHGAWNAGFSRHSPPQAGGGAKLIARDGAHARNANTHFSRVAGRSKARNQD